MRFLSTVQHFAVGLRYSDLCMYDNNWGVIVPVPINFRAHIDSYGLTVYLVDLSFEIEHDCLGFLRSGKIYFFMITGVETQ